MYIDLRAPCTVAKIMINSLRAEGCDDRLDCEFVRTYTFRKHEISIHHVHFARPLRLRSFRE